MAQAAGCAVGTVKSRSRGPAGAPGIPEGLREVGIRYGVPGCTTASSLLPARAAGSGTGRKRPHAHRGMSPPFPCRDDGAGANRSSRRSFRNTPLSIALKLRLAARWPNPATESPSRRDRWGRSLVPAGAVLLLLLLILPWYYGREATRQAGA